MAISSQYKIPSRWRPGIERALDKPISMNMLTYAVNLFEDATVLTRHFEVLGLVTP